MESTVQEILASIWIYIIEWPVAVRIGIPLLLLGTLVAFLSSILLPRLSNYLVRFLTKIFEILFSILLYPEYVFSKLRRKGRKQPFPLAYSIGDTFYSIISTFSRMSKQTDEWRNRNRFLFKRFARGIWAISGIVIILLFINPSMNVPLVSHWYSFEEWVLENVDQSTNAYTATAMTESAEEKQKEKEEEKVYYKLKEKYSDGAYIRKEPDLNASVLTTAQPDEQLLYLNEKKEDGQRFWLKIQTEKGKIGWISNVVVKEVKN